MAIIGHYVVDSFLLQEAGVAKELVLCLCFHETLTKLIKSVFMDTGNVAVMIVSLLMMRMQLFAVNSRNTS